MSPSELQATFAELSLHSADLKRRMDVLQDTLDETRYPEVPFDHPSWFADCDRWAPCPVIPPGTAIVPPELDPEEFDALFPFLVSASA